MRSSKLIKVLIVVTLMFIINIKAVQAVDTKLIDISGHWAEKSILEIENKGITKGYLDNTFKPDSTINRAEFITLINNGLDLSDIAQINYFDVNASDWFATDVAKAKAAGYISGYPDGSIKPYNNITRQEAATIVAKILKLDGAENNINEINKFRDSDKIAIWSRNAIAGVINAGYIKGYPDQTFRPTGQMTRAEAATILCKIIQAENQSGQLVIIKDVKVTGNIGEFEFTTENLVAKECFNNKIKVNELIAVITTETNENGNKWTAKVLDNNFSFGTEYKITFKYPCSSDISKLIWTNNMTTVSGKWGIYQNSDTNFDQFSIDITGIPQQYYWGLYTSRQKNMGGIQRYDSIVTSLPIAFSKPSQLNIVLFSDEMGKNEIGRASILGSDGVRSGDLNIIMNK